MTHEKQQNNQNSSMPEDILAEEFFSEDSTADFVNMPDENAETDDTETTAEDVNESEAEVVPEAVAVPPEKIIAELKDKNKLLESKADDLTGQLAKVKNQLTLREGEFEKLADAYRKLREALDKIESQHKTEFDNYRRRTEDEKKRISDKSVGDFVLALLPSLDNLDRAMKMLDSASEISTVRDGVVMIADGLKQVLAAKGLERIESVGEPFNPEYHNAMATVTSTDVPEGYVADEMLPGYTLKGQLLRPSMVRVAHAPDEE